MKDTLFGHSTDALLDDPVQAACDSGWSQWVQSQGAAQALPAFIGHFATLCEEDPKGGEDLAALIAKRKAPVLFLKKAEITVPAPVECLKEFGALQMVLSKPPDLPDMDEITLLEMRDAEDMLALAQISKPGPFAIGTPLLGKFLGIRQNGHLIAMAGQRINLPGWVEISGVCVHPDFHGRGLGADLTCAMVHLILSGAAMPFLHTYRENHRAISLYERLGFQVRTEMHLASVGLPREQAQ
ncbi:MAG: GNAT family N-acetyltransferase [Pseudomonadota bacterium]